MSYELKPWSWLVPAVFVGLLFGLVLWLGTLPMPEVQYCAGGLVVVMLVLVVQAVSGYRAYFREIHVEQMERLKRAESLTALSMKLESARGVHPDVVKAFMSEENRVWALRHGNRALKMIPHSVLYRAPEVTDLFVDYFIKSSSDLALMPKRLLVEGRKNRFDPWGLVDEYTMYDRLVALLASEGKIIKYSEFEGYTWAPPWTRKMVAEDFALVWEEEGEEKSV